MQKRCWNFLTKSRAELLFNKKEYKVAIISDIHANLTALEAVMDYIDRLGVDEIICLGDVVGKGAFPVETIDLCRNRCSETLLGNHEDFFLTDPDVDHYRWVKDIISEDQYAWLSERPVRKDLYISGRKIRLCHAGPENVHQRVYPKQEKSLKFDLFQPLEPGDRKPDVYGYGDVHYAYIEYFESAFTLFNCGSVGNSMELPQASFAILSGTLTEPSEEAWAIDDHEKASPFGIQFLRVPYNINKEIEATLASTMPERGRDIYLEEIRTGTWGKRWSRHS
ncbi:MAG: metallophosphoesterase family protein [Spirochaetales bacterium]|nr:metallophosphoesterase family protein [Spirochaetales bacterium]